MGQEDADEPGVFERLVGNMTVEMLWTWFPLLFTVFT